MFKNGPVEDYNAACTSLERLNQAIEVFISGKSEKNSYNANQSDSKSARSQSYSNSDAVKSLLRVRV